MPGQVILKRKRYFLAVEGESEQSFVTWLQRLASEIGLPVHLDDIPLGGGGFKSMLKNAVHSHDRNCKTKGAYRDRFLIVDEDRAEQGDWSIEKLRQEAARHKFIVCVQRPNHEGLLYRMNPGNQNDIPSAASAATKLKSHWPNYQKPANAYQLERRYSLNDLLRVAGVDADLEILLKRIGLTAD